jgi:hypothetical protein
VEVRVYFDFFPLDVINRLDIIGMKPRILLPLSLHHRCKTLFGVRKMFRGLKKKALICLEQFPA